MSTAPKQVSIVEQPTAIAITPAVMLDRAIASGNVEIIERMSAIYERWEDRQRRIAFEDALARAKASIPVIIKNRQVDFTSQKGRTNYRYEDLAEVVRVVEPILAAQGLSIRFRTTSLPNEPVTVTCIVFGHGHSEENTLSAGRDESGNKNSIQAIGSTVTYLQRYTLKAALGLASSTDDDGRAAGPSVNPDDGGMFITDDQMATIQKLVLETKSDVNRLLKYARAESLADIPRSRFTEIVGMLEAKKRKT